MLKKLCKEDNISWTNHVLQRLIQRGIHTSDVVEAIMTGEIIEDYPDDYPYPSCLVLGSNKLHVVCGVGEGRLWIITAYSPTPDKWESDLKTRRRPEV
ncbi:DUF4258 domain-containing protein [Selenomonas ruminantium]|uniref:DUF4258 domain-containing protein n=1 Tax=Selenomonas ruminantium TaxID=971 RepID=UPI00047E9821|nr:DUF4258 domain-containing protein [Selenomonas ruminantium]